MGLKKFNEFVQLDELSKRTLGDYIMHATQSYANHQEKRNKHRDDAQIVGRMDHNASGPVRQSVASTVDTLHKAANVHDDKRHKRGRGIMKAVKRLTAEGVEAVTDEEIDEIFENFEQLDEISKQTLGNYVKKAANEVGFSSHDFGSAQQRAVSAKRGSQDELDNTNAAHAARLKAVKRFNGIRKAADKLVKEGAEALSFDELELLGENFEQLDELSKDTLKSYIKKATASNAAKKRVLDKQDRVIRSHGMHGWDDQAQRASEIIGKHVKPFHRRRNAIELAKRKLGEEVLDESFKTGETVHGKGAHYGNPVKGKVIKHDDTHAHVEWDLGKGETHVSVHSQKNGRSKSAVVGIPTNIRKAENQE